MQIINQELQKVSWCEAYLSLGSKSLISFMQRLEVEQAEQERLVTNERQLKAEISKLKNLTSSSQLVSTCRHDC